MNVYKHVFFGFLLCSLLTLFPTAPALANTDDGRFGFGYSTSPAYNLGEPYGLLVTQVFPNSPAEQIGMVPGDVITGINNNYFPLTPQNYDDNVKHLRAGDTYSFHIARADRIYPHDIVATATSNINTGCDIAQARAEFNQAIASNRSNDATEALLHSRKALNEYETCFFHDSISDGISDLMKIADSYLLLGAEYQRASGGSYNQDQHFFSLAHAFFLSIISLDNAPAGVAAAAQRKLALIEQASPKTRQDEGRSALFDSIIESKRLLDKAATSLPPSTQHNASANPIGN